MRHSNLVDKYDKAQSHFQRGNYRRASRLFKQIVWELSATDSDSMADIQLHNSAESYLDEIRQKEGVKSMSFFWIGAIVILIVIVYFILR